MWCLLFISAVASSSPASEKTAARATVRILKSVRISEQEWRSQERRTERVITDEHGRKRRLRLVEFE